MTSQQDVTPDRFRSIIQFRSHRQRFSFKTSSESRRLGEKHFANRNLLLIRSSRLNIVGFVLSFDECCQSVTRFRVASDDGRNKTCAFYFWTWRSSTVAWVPQMRFLRDFGWKLEVKREIFREISSFVSEFQLSMMDACFCRAKRGTKEFSKVFSENVSNLLESLIANLIPADNIDD